MKYLLLTAALLLTPFGLPATAHACGPDSDCMIGERTYRIRMPEESHRPVGAIVFNHGYRGTAAGLMRNKNLGKAIGDMGLAFVAPKSAGPDWDIPNAPGQAGKGGNEPELAYFDALKADLVEKHGIDGDRIMITGFSAGGMMVWELACKRGETFAAFAPISGTFWSPVPASCPTLPVPMIHMHGTSDRIVPLKGRPIQDTHQGDIYKALKLAAPKETFSAWRSMGEADGLTCQQRQSEAGGMVQLCVHPGGHTLKSAWIVRAWKEFERIGAL